MRALRFYAAVALALGACTAIDVTFEEPPIEASGGTGGTGGSGGSGGTGGETTVGGFAGMVSMAGQGGDEGMAGQGGSPEEGPCAGLDDGDYCDDEDPCTESDVCEAGECVGSPMFCDDGNECTADSCVDGECTSEDAEDGTPCGDDTVANCDAADICIAGTCDAQIGPDGAACDDGDPQTGLDTCTGLVCAGVPACADGTVEEAFAGRMVGCAGVVSWTDRATLCGEGLRVCKAREWTVRRGEAAPTHNYWTEDRLGYEGDASGSCSAPPAGTACSDADSPMRVCGAATDPEGNTCQWIDCGFQSRTPNEYFGGCGIPNPSAGTLCCW